MGIAIVIFCTSVLFLGMILLLAAKPKYAGKITGTFVVLVGVGGLLIYGYGYAVTIDNLGLAIIRALMSVCGMYMGRNELSAISDTPLMSHGWMHVIFWLLHLFALYATASAAITTIGAEALKKLRLWLLRRGQLNVIYGVHDDSLALGKQLIGQKKSVVVFVDAKPAAGQAAAVDSAGCVLRSDGSALSADLRFLRMVGLRKNREVVLYALHKDVAANIAYAKNLLNSMEKMGVTPENTRLVILGKNEETVGTLQTQNGRYGYGAVSEVNEAELAARLLIRQCPPCDAIAFDEQGRASQNFEVLVIGFGKTGRAVLRQLVMNGQFEGSNFRADVFASDLANTHGFFTKQYVGMLREYDISFHDFDARSAQMYKHLDERFENIKYVAICTGNDKLNGELAQELAGYFCQQGRTIPICQCDRSGIRIQVGDSQEVHTTRLYDAKLLSREGLDRMAMVLNHRYQPTSDKTALENWMECDYFSRQSCRASADFAPAMLRMAGISDQEAMQGWQPTGQLLLNLSKTEHLRWNAFHFCMGFSTMTDEEFDSRATEYLRQKSEGKATIRISKNMANRSHACLVSWDGLEALSKKESAITGKDTDYQRLDTENVLALPSLLRAAEGSEV